MLNTCTIILPCLVQDHEPNFVSASPMFCPMFWHQTLINACSECTLRTAHNFTNVSHSSGLSLHFFWRSIAAALAFPERYWSIESIHWLRAWPHTSWREIVKYIGNFLLVSSQGHINC